MPPRLCEVDILINTACNCRCEHCFSQAFRGGRDTSPLSSAEKAAAIKEFRKCGAFAFSLQGGEPFLAPDLDMLIQACKPSESYITIVTNGADVSTGRLEQVYRLGVDKIAVSLDSSIAHEHDKFRGLPGCHERAMKTLMAAREIGLDIGINVTVTNESLYTKGIQDLFSLAKKERIPTDVNIPQPVGNWDGRIDLLITEDNARYLDQLHKEEPLIRRGTHTFLGKTGCPVATQTLSMNSYGDVFPCVFMHIAIGNIRNNFIRDMQKAVLTAVPEFRTYPSRCLAGEDRSFISKYISTCFGVRKPANGEKIFGMKSVPLRVSEIDSASRQ